MVGAIFAKARLRDVALFEVVGRSKGDEPSCGRSDCEGVENLIPSLSTRVRGELLEKKTIQVRSTLNHR